MRRFLVRAIPVLALGPGLAVAPPLGPGQVAADSAAIVTLEHTWLQATDTATLGRILAPDFVHIVPGGLFLTRRQHLEWVATHPRSADVRLRFGRLRVRLYGDVAIATGTVLRTDVRGGLVLRTAFTDVFVKRGGRWRAVNAQEDRVAAAGATGAKPHRL